jgi:hypothetical protein
LIQDLKRQYMLGKVSFTIFTRDNKWFKELGVGSSFQVAKYTPEDFEEWMLTARITARIHQMIGVTVEYVRSEVSDATQPELDRIEWILHIHY